jgi:hypothetical protein
VSGDRVAQSNIGGVVAVYYSFHYDRDNWRVQQVMNMGVVEGQPLLTSQKWEEVKRSGDAAIEKWIEENMRGKEAVVVLVGAETAARKWVRYEIVKAWNDKKKLVGVRIHGLEDVDGHTDRAGANPFALIKLDNGKTIADYVTLHNPAGADSKAVYASIKNNLRNWVDSGYKRT